MDKHRYNSPEARFAKVNRVFILGGDILFVVMLMYVLMYRNEAGMKQSTFIGNCVVLILFIITNTLVYIKNTSSGKLRLLISAEVCIEFVFYSLTTTASFMGFALVGVVGISLAYYDKRFFNGVFLLCTTAYLVCQFVRVSMGLMVFDANGICMTVINCAVFIMLMRIGSITKAFSDDSLAAIEEQKRTQDQMMEEILDISQIVKSESDRSSGLMRLLVDSAQQTAANARVISRTTDTIAGSLETQTRMTRDIQGAIDETKTYADEMVTIAGDSSGQIRENTEMMAELKEQSALISDTNAKVTESMERLQQRTLEVKSFARIILDISEQTNLLAINASIESARAGAAGSGFAVIAGQIRRLADETRRSTESITRIVDELNKNEEEVASIVRTSVDAAEKQSEMILMTAEMFNRLGKNMAQLISNISVIDGKIENLSVSNNAMVDSISEISGSTQEVSANAVETNEITAKNLDYAQNTSRAIDSIQKTASRLEQYI